MLCQQRDWVGGVRKVRKYADVILGFSLKINGKIHSKLRAVKNFSKSEFNRKTRVKHHEINLFLNRIMY